LPITHIALPDISDHNLISALAKDRRLGAFFRELFELEHSLPNHRGFRERAGIAPA
jgi:hypothetical protein